MHQRTTLRRFLFALTAIGGAFAPSLLSAAPGEPQLVSADARELWRKGSDQILAGDFADATRTLEMVQKIEPDHAVVKSALSWMHEASRLATSREGYRRRVYDFYVKMALDAAKVAREGKPDPEPEANAEDGESAKTDKPAEDDGDDDERYRWSKALLYAQSAMTVAHDDDAFRAEPWLPEIVENAKLEIKRHQEAGEWRDALAVYDILKRIYPDNEEYEDGYRFCRKRAHLEFVYGKKSTWRTDLADVTPGAVFEILRRIDEDYVEAPDYREMCRTALEHLLILAKSESLADRFSTLGEKDLVARFVNRLNALIKKKIDSRRRFNVSSVRTVFRSVLRANEETLRLPESVVVDEFAAGLIEPLDEFTSVIWPAEVSEFNKQTRGEFVGVGIQITQPIGQPVRVESPLEDSPAYRAGIKPGDLITEVEGKPTVDMTITEAVRAITGEPGTIVVLTIEDPITKETRKVPLKRSRIKIRTVRGNNRDAAAPTGWNYFLDEHRKIGYIRVSGFMDDTVSDLEKALDQLDSEGCRGLILDLRFNPGGLLTSAVNMCELFLEEGAPIVRTKGRTRHQNMTITSKSARSRTNLPLIILVNEYSASASEIVSGALAGLKHACVVGTRTFGKGSVQNLIPIADNQAYLKLTTAHYYLPDMDLPGDDPWYLLHRKPRAKTWGVEPHIKVDVIPHETSKILRLRRERDVLKGRDQAEIPEEVLERRATSQPAEDDFPKDPDPDVDPQLLVALDLMRVKLVSHQPWALAPRLERTLTVADVPSAVKSQSKSR